MAATAPTRTILANRAKLLAALRAEMPEGFKFDYRTVLAEKGRCGTVGCGIGLAYSLGLIPYPNSREIGLALGIKNNAVEAIFYNGVTYGAPRWDWSSVTPAMVADELEAHLRSLETEGGQ
jgi:hypothetical protein